MTLFTQFNSITAPSTQKGNQFWRFCLKFCFQWNCCPLLCTAEDVGREGVSPIICFRRFLSGPCWQLLMKKIVSVNVGQRLPKQLLQNFPGIWIGRHFSEWSSRYPWPDSLRSQDEGPIQVDGDKHDHLLTMTGVKKFNLILNISSIKMVYKERRYAPAYFHDIVGMAPFRFNYLHLQPQLFFNFGSKWVPPRIQNMYF